MSSSDKSLEHAYNIDRSIQNFTENLPITDVDLPGIVCVGGFVVWTFWTAKNSGASETRSGPRERHCWYRHLAAAISTCRSAPSLPYRKGPWTVSFHSDRTNPAVVASGVEVVQNSVKLYDTNCRFDYIYVILKKI